MIRWYDYPIAFLAADVMATFLSIPIIGAFVAWGVYEMWMQVYCQYRLKQEENK